MKSRLYTLVIAALMFFALLGTSTPALSTCTNLLEDVGSESSTTFDLPGDAVVQFPDSTFEAVVREEIGKPVGDIMASDVSGITTLYVRRLGIVSLKGIEYFTALEWLDCRSNDLATLDVSHNTALEELWCDGNNLTELDVSKNTMLTVLSCWINQLTTLDVSHNPALGWLACGENRLTTLDVTHNPLLHSLSCSTNQLVMLDVSQNPLLVGLYCAENQLMALDVSHNTALEQLACNGNQLTTLDVSHNPSLITLWCKNNLFSDKSNIIGLDESRLREFVFNPQNDK
ncbi:MAG: hypothetical protein FWF47_02785 [Clostridia bacterium]|nr:hypothetical protein [Clostridia bacterium]